jgi:monoamine oxidase
MNQLTRRSFLAGSGALIAAPALGAPATSGEVDVVIVGAGAAGIAAARRIAAAGRRFALVEAADRIGGRCITDTRTFGVPFDRGAHWIYTPDVNPVARLAPRTGLELYPAPTGQKIRIGRRNAREGELEDFLAAVVRANRGIADASRGRTDVPCTQALPRDLGDWRATAEFVLGPYNTSTDLHEISAMDFARMAERDSSAFCRQGFGALLAKLGEGLPVQLSTPATRIDWTSDRVSVETARGRFGARHAIVTASTGVLAAGKIRFTPDLPRRQVDAISRLKLGSFDHIALELEGNPLGLQRDDLVFEKSSGARTAAVLANVSGSSLAVVEVGGRFGRELSARGEQVMVEFAVDWLAGLYGPDVKKAVKRSQVTRWNEEPWVLGAFSTAAPGGQGARRVMMETLRDRVYFAGEAVHETLWGTVGGAWESGERTAETVLRKMGALRDAQEPKRQQPRRRQR